MYSYVVNGLAIRSDLLLPELVSHAAGIRADVVIRLGNVDHSPPQQPNSEGYVHLTLEDAYFFWEAAGAFLVRAGREIVVEPASGVEQRVVRTYILGSAMGVLLHQRGLLALHASAIAVSGRAVAFIGESGWGKSTMAAAMHARGHAIVADDIVAVSAESGGAPAAFPAFPRLKLYPETAASLGYDRGSLTVFDPEDERREYRVVGGFPQVPLPLYRIYVLAEGEGQEVETLHPQEGFMELIRHSYALGRLQAAGATAAHFHQCAQIAGMVPIYRLKRQRSLSALSDVARLVEEHVAHGEEVEGVNF
jgi:hypothetical protein